MSPAHLSALPGGKSGKPRHHILSVLVENKAGVLSRVAGLFSRRGFNIYSWRWRRQTRTNTSAASHCRRRRVGAPRTGDHAAGQAGQRGLHR